MVKSRGIWNLGIGSLALVLLLWILKATNLLALEGIFYAVLNPIAALLLMVAVYLIALGAGQSFFHGNKAWRPFSALLTLVWEYMLLH